MKQRKQNARNGRPRGRLGTRAVALVAAFALVMSMCPGTAALAFASGQLTVGTQAQGGDPYRELPRYVLGENVNTPNAMSVIFGGKRWRVIGYDGQGVAQTPDSGTMTLLLAGKENMSGAEYGFFQFNYSPNESNHYAGSTLQSVIASVYDGLTLSEAEKSAIVARDLEGNGQWGKGCDAVAGETVNGQKLWPLSTKEALALDRSISEIWNEWWLRSPGEYRFGATVAKVDTNGYVKDYGSLVHDACFARPACHISLASLVSISRIPDGQANAGWYTLKFREAPHTHSYQYAASGATITATCSAQGCAGPEQSVALTIVEPAFSIYGEAKDTSVTLDGLADFNGITGLEVKAGDVTYVGRNGTAYEQSLVAPTVPGDYTASITVEGQTASLDYSVPKPMETIPVTSDTHTMTTGAYRVSGNVEIKPGDRGNSIQVAAGAKVLLIIDEGATLTVTGADAEVAETSNYMHVARGRAAILLPQGATLTVAGAGTLNAQGGKALDGYQGYAAEASGMYTSGKTRTGGGGWGGWGGGGAGAGIGTDGGTGGDVNFKTGGEGAVTDGMTTSNVYGNDGAAGSPGYAADPAGTLIVTGSVTVNAKGGAAGKGGGGGSRGKYYQKKDLFVGTSCGTSGGGGGGGGGSAADGIGSGGTGGGGGGGGAAGNIDGESAFFEACDLDDLWGHGGNGGSSTWGGTAGSKGDEGASNGGDSTGASKKYAKAGGAGGSCPTPKTVAFYTYKDTPSSKPTVNCTAGHGVTRNAIPLGSLNAFKGVGGVGADGKPHGNLTGKLGAQSVDPAALSARSADVPMLAAQATSAAPLGAQSDDEIKWVESGTETVEGVEVPYKVAYYDASTGAPLDAAPTDPGQYVALVRYTCPAPYEDYSGDWIVPFDIAKRQVAVPTPAELTFDCEDWETGEGRMQKAFPNLDETDFRFVSDAVAADGTTSTREAKAAGSYMACFELADPETCEWADGSGSGEVWVPWSIALAPFDPADPEIMRWGTANGDTTTKLTYTGEPTWVRPWFTPAEAIDGDFPDWFSHWGGAGRPYADRRSACVYYLAGDNDRDGLVGYHTNADGTLEPVTALQVYAWMFGVDVGGTHVAVKSGQKVWYKTGEDGWKVPLSVGGGKPAGAEGYIVARAIAYADKLGVKDAGTYRAYAFFDDGAGFAATSLAEATVIVAKAANAVTVKTAAKSVKASKVAKKAQTVKPITKATARHKATVTYAKATTAAAKKLNGYKDGTLTVNKKTGKVTVKKGTKAGTYRLMVKVTAAATANARAATKTFTVTVKVTK